MNANEIKAEFKKAQSMVVRHAHFKQYMQAVSKKIKSTNIDEILASIYSDYQEKAKTQNKYYGLPVYLDDQIEKVTGK